MFINKLLFALLLSIITAYSQDEVNLKISVISHIAKDDSIFISGNGIKLGNWNPSKINLNRTNDSTFSREFKFEKGSSIEFKFTRGSWNSEAVNENGIVPSNNIVMAFNDTSIVYEINYWKDQFAQSSGNFAGQITGTVEYHKNLSYKFLQPRDLIVWLPENYYESDQSYPVLYMHDGQNIFDPKTASFGIDWQIDETADSLIRNEIIDPMIIVGIYNTFNRMYEYTPNDTGFVYSEFVVNKVKRMIDSLYRTKPEREYTFTGGSSAGGLISFMLLWNYSEVFSKAVCMSPAFKIAQLDFVSPVKNYNGLHKDFKVYIDNGGIALEEDLQPGIDEMLTALKEKGYKEGKDFLWVKDKEAQHSESAWALRIPNAFKWLFAK
ncbi:MAG: hypothetical protein K8F60_18070 [Melioribacteraceae bacterium]|nr:hypothetical protein [Melioribacteraceae bacterium]